MYFVKLNKTHKNHSTFYPSFIISHKCFKCSTFGREKY